jgi:hypothetical protein
MTWLGQIFHHGCERQTTVDRAVKGLAIGALTGAAIVSLFALPLGPLAIFVFVFAFVIWVAGLFLVAAPGWWMLHRLGARCQQAAMIYGGGLTFFVVSAWVWIPGLIYGAAMSQMMQILPFAGLMTIPGIIVGWVVANVAYSPPATAA